MKENYLIHAGVKGMKWGVRKKVEPVGNGRSGSGKSNTESANQTQAQQPNKKKTVGKVLGIAAGATAIAGLVTAGAVLVGRAMKKRGNFNVKLLKAPAFDVDISEIISKDGRSIAKFD